MFVERVISETLAGLLDLVAEVDVDGTAFLELQPASVGLRRDVLQGGEGLAGGLEGKPHEVAQGGPPDLDGQALRPEARPAAGAATD